MWIQGNKYKGHIINNIVGPTAFNLPTDLIPPEKVNPDIAMKIMPKVQVNTHLLID
jgi:hypothetical protein